MQGEHGDSFIGFIRERSRQARQELLDQPYAAEVDSRFRKLAQVSIEEQAAIEAADTLPFEAFRQDYVSTRRLEV